MIDQVDELHLFNLKTAPGESSNVASTHPEIVAQLMKRIDSARKELGDIDVTGSGARFFDTGSRQLEDPLKGQKPPTARPAK
jgi:hypothetical protein